MRPIEFLSLHNKNVAPLKEAGIYAIFCAQNEKLYVGRAANINRRWSQHRSLLIRGKHHNSHLQAAWNLYRERSFSFHILSMCPKEALFEQEALYVSQIDRSACFNQAAITDAYQVTPEVSVKISRGLSGKKRGPLSEETRRKIAIAHLGKKRGPHSEEHRQKISISNKRRLFFPASEETRRKLSALRLGKKRPPFSEEWKRKIGEASRKRMSSEEARRKQSERALKMKKRNGRFSKE